MQMPRKNVERYRTPFEELPNEMSLEDPNTSSKSEYKRLKYIEDNILAALCGHKKCKCCNSVKSIINEIVSFNLLKMTPNDSGFSPQSTGSWKINYEIPSGSLDGSDLDAYMPPIKVLSNITIQKQGESNKMNLKGNNNKAKITHLQGGQNTSDSDGDEFQSEENKKIPMKKRRKRKSHYQVPGNKPRKPRVKKSTSPLKQAEVPSCSPDTSAKNVYLATLDRSGRFKEKSLKNKINERETTNINDDRQAVESDSNEFLNEDDHISTEDEFVKENNKKATGKKKRIRKSHYIVPGSKPHKSKIKEGTFPLKIVKKRTTAEQKNVEDDENKKNIGSLGKKRKSGGNTTERPTKKPKSNLNESGSEVDASSTPLEFSKREAKKSSGKGNIGTSALNHKFIPQRLVFSPECSEEEINEGNDKQKMSKSKRRSEGGCKYRETPPLRETLEVQPKRSKPLRHANFLNGGHRAALTEVFYRSKNPQINSQARSYIYALIDNKKFKISHDRTKSKTFSKAVLKRLSRKGGCGITLGASFLERESLRLHPMKNRKSIYSPGRWLTSKLFDDMCLYD